MKTSPRHHVYCPGCGEWIRVSIWDSLLGRALCDKCGLLKKTIRIEPSEEFSQILVPPDSFTHSFFSVTMFIAFVFGLFFIFLVIFTKWRGVIFSLTLLVLLILVFFAVLRGGSFGELSLSDRYLYSKEILLHGTTVTIRMLLPNGDKTIDIDCSPENKPCVFLSGSTLPTIQITTLHRRVSFGSGLEPDSANQLVDLLQDFLQVIAGNSSSVSKSVAEIAQQLKSEGTAYLEDSGQSSQEQSSQKTRVEIVDKGDVLILRTSALLDTRKWIIFSAIVAVLVILLCLLWHIGLRFGFGIGISAGILANLMDIKVEIRSFELTIVYRIFKLISWKRVVAIEQIIDVGNKWTGSCAIITPGRSYRISHFSNPNSRSELANLVKMYLTKRAGWQQKTRLSIDILSGIPQKITLPPSGMRTFEELGFNLFGAIFLCLLFIPLICFIEVVPLIVFIPNILDHFNNIARITVPCHALIGLYLVAKLVKAAVIIMMEASSVHQEVRITTSSISQKPKLIICRCLWGTSGFRHRFTLDEPIVVNIERPHQDEETFVGITQGKRKARIGSSLSWEDQQQLKVYLDQILLDNQKTST
jgi:uncharacterized membrane protein